MFAQKLFYFGHLPFWSQLDVLGVSSHLNWKSYRVDFRFFQNFIFGVKLNYRKFEFQIRPYVYIADGVATWASFFLIRFVMLTFDNGIKLRNRITVQSPLFVIFHPFEVILTSFRRFFFENIQFLDFLRVDISGVFYRVSGDFKIFWRILGTFRNNFEIKSFLEHSNFWSVLRRRKAPK